MRQKARSTWPQIVLWRAWPAILAGVALLSGLLVLTPVILQVVPFRVMLLAGCLYLIAHGLRAVRLSLLAGALLGISLRSGVLMHLATAPVVNVLPLKLGELLRLQQLARMSGALVDSVIVILLDRMFDSIFLLPIVVYLMMSPSAGSVDPTLVFLTLLIAILPMIIVILGPGIATGMQSYIVTHHQNPRALHILPGLDRMRRLLVKGARIVRGNGAQLGLLSLLIWGCELLVTWLFARQVAHGTAEQTLALLTDRLAYSWFDSDAAPITVAASALTLLTLLVILPFVLPAYLRRSADEPRRQASKQERTGRRARNGF